METVFQVVVIGAVALITYWWANQGLFSAMLHFVCVVLAGVITFAFWEPLVVGVLLRNSWFDNYAWGASFVAIFALSLVGLRLAFDKLVPANVDLPNNANLIFGGVFGFGSAVLSVGMGLLGMGMLQSNSVIMGFTGVSRSNDVRQAVTAESTLWLPVHTWTTEFFEFLSVGSMYPTGFQQPLKQYFPDLDKHSFRLVRDTFKEGRSRTTLPPESVSIAGVWRTDDRVIVGLKFMVSAFDHADQLIVSKSQVRLLAYRNGRTFDPVSVGHPDRWTQQLQGERWNTYLFDDPSHFATSIPGQQQSTVYFEFPVGSSGEYGFIERGATPLFVQVKGVRYDLPPAEAVEPTALAGLRTDGFNMTLEPLPEDPTAPFVRGQDIEISNSIFPLSISINSLRSIEANEDRFLTNGFQAFIKGAERGNRDTRVLGIYSAPGAKVIKVNVSRDSTANIFDDVLLGKVGGAETASPVLIDQLGRRYYPKGYILDLSIEREVHINLQPGSPITSVADLPRLPTSNTNKLWLLYEVTEGVTLTSFRLNDFTIVRCNIPVNP